MEITLSRNYHLSLGKDTFSSIDTHVTLTIKDIKEDEYQKKYKALSEIMDATIALETNKSLTEAESMFNIMPSLSNYNKGLDKATIGMYNLIEENCKLL